MVNKEQYSRKFKKNLIDKLSQQEEVKDLEEEKEITAKKSAVKKDNVPAEDNSIEVRTEEESTKTVGENEEWEELKKKREEKAKPKTEKKKGRLKGFLLPMIPLGILAIIAVIYVIRGKPKQPNYIGPLSVASISYEEDINYKMPLPSCKRTSFLFGPEIEARSYIAVDADTFQILAENNAGSEIPFASIAKLLGILVALEEYDLDTELSLKNEVDTEGNGIDLTAGEFVTVENLIGAAVVGSKNDAVYVLAQNYPGGVEAFVEKMNEKADDLGMASTTIKNPIGLDDPEQMSTPRDLAVLAIVTMRDPVIKGFAKEPVIYIPTSLERDIKVYSTNLLLGDVDGVIGLKTGYTEDAGQCLVTYVQGERAFVTVVLNSEDRAEESRKLIEWVRNNYTCDY